MKIYIQTTQGGKAGEKVLVKETRSPFPVAYQALLKFSKSLAQTVAIPMKAHETNLVKLLSRALDNAGVPTEAGQGTEEADVIFKIVRSPRTKDKLLGEAVCDLKYDIVVDAQGVTEPVIKTNPKITAVVIRTVVGGQPYSTITVAETKASIESLEHIVEHFAKSLDKEVPISTSSFNYEKYVVKELYKKLELSSLRGVSINKTPGDKVILQMTRTPFTGSRSKMSYEIISEINLKDGKRTHINKFTKPVVMTDTAVEVPTLGFNEPQAQVVYLNHPATPELEGNVSSHKMVIVINRGFEPKLRRGKEIAQACHAAIGAYKQAATSFGAMERDKILTGWQDSGSKKVTVHVNSEEALQALAAECVKHKLNHYLVKDAASTELKVPSFTALAIGPDTEERVNLVSKGLPLY